MYNAKEVEKEVLKFWEKRRIPHKIVAFDKKKPKFYLLDGPPYVNGIPHVGHIKTTTFKDVWGKFKSMQGYAVWYQPGFDCSGLPIENAVEQKLGIKSKKDIEDRIGVDKFIKECRNLAETNLHIWMGIYKKLAAWRGWLDPYLTYKNYYLESGWWTVKKWYEKGLFVEGNRPGFWCPRCETVLSGYETTDSYKNVVDPSIFIKFPVHGKKKEYLLVWTTTPWTLPGNVAVCVHPDEPYVRVAVQDFTLILAEKRLSVLVNLEIGYKVLDKFPGRKLAGMRYEPVLDIPLQKELPAKNVRRVILSMPIMKQRVASKVAAKRGGKEEFSHVVDMSTGSGLVHIAPGHGDADNRLGKHYKLPELSPVDEAGKFTREAGRFAGVFVKKADSQIIEYLENNSLLLYAGKITHSYPLCWRCKSPLIYRMSEQWYLSLDKLRSRVLSGNRKARWLPDFARERFHNLVSEAPDWAVTRQRYWGIPLPIWSCQKCGKKIVIGSRKELVKKAKRKLKADMDMHKNVVDKVTIPCPCGGKAKREKSIMDVWFDSGIAPWASLGYPFSNKALFDHLWPVNLVDESQDQVRGWFYTLMLSGFATFGEKPFDTVCLNGWTLDEKGEKMSKSLGNVILAEDAYKELGADLLRLYNCCNIAPWETQKFSLREAKELHRMLNVLWNTYRFTETYGKKKLRKPATLALEDKWIVSRINSLVKEVTDDLDNFRFHYAGRRILDFVLNDFSRWYVKLIRDRVSIWYSGKDKAAAQWALTHVFERLLPLMAPITPFISEKIYQGMFSSDSVHLTTWPKPDSKAINARLEKDMELAKAVIEAMSFARQEGGLKLRWPLTAVTISLKDKATEASMKRAAKVIEFMGNVKEVVFAKRAPRGAREFEFGKLALGKVLKDEALLRELVRNVQMSRKKENLKVTEKVTLWLSSDKKTEKLLSEHKNFLLPGVGAREVRIGKLVSEKGKLVFEGSEIAYGFRKSGK